MRTYTDPVTGESFPVIDSRGDVDKCFNNNNDGVSKGLEQRDYAAQGVGSLPFSAPFDIPEIPRSEWADRIRESEKYQSRLLDVALANSLPRLNQQQTSFCWINCVINAIHHTRALMGDRHVSLSPASAGGPIKGYRNQGGWPSDGIEYIATNGVCPVELWPANAIDKKYDNDESRDARKEFACTEWYDLKPDNFGQLVTALLLGYPVANGRMWWSHATLSIQPVILSPTEFGIMDDNSWGPGFGNKGRFILSEKMGAIDGGVALRNSVTLR
jgi:hypothetical protein